MIGPRIHSLFRNDPGPQSCEELCVISRGPDYMVARLVRTEKWARPEEWKLVTSRMPDRWVEGFVGRMWFTPLEFEYTQGKRELA